MTVLNFVMLVSWDRRGFARKNEQHMLLTIGHCCWMIVSGVLSTTALLAEYTLYSYAVVFYLRVNM